MEDIGSYMLARAVKKYCKFKALKHYFLTCTCPWLCPPVSMSMFLYMNTDMKIDVDRISGRYPTSHTGRFYLMPEKSLRIKDVFFRLTQYWGNPIADTKSTQVHVNRDRNEHYCVAQEIF
jgi:hypothetical protein